MGVVRNSGRNGMDSRKQAVSIRMNRGDVRHVKCLADRLGVRDSDIIRFAIKAMLAKLAPLSDPTVRGRQLLPVFVESGADLMRHFDLDAMRLAEIINDGSDAGRRVDAEDIQLIAMNGNQPSYLKMRFAGIGRGPDSERAHPAQANGSAHQHGEVTLRTNGHSAEPVNGNGAHAFASEIAASSTEVSLRQYLYTKYLFAQAAEAGNQGATRS